MSECKIVSHVHLHPYPFLPILSLFFLYTGIITLMLRITYLSKFLKYDIDFLKQRASVMLWSSTLCCFRLQVLFFQFEISTTGNLSVKIYTYNMRQVQPETLPKNSNFSSCLQNIKLKNNTT